MKAITKVLLTFSLTIWISQSLACINFSAPTIVNSSCNEDNGSITLNHDGTAPFTYTWSHDSNLNSATADSLAPGTYMVTVSDDANCTNDITIVILEKSFDLTGNTTPDTCGAPNGSATVEIVAGSGGTAPFTYAWSNSAGNQTTQTATNLESGVYSVTVTDNEGCTASLNLNVSSEKNGFTGNVFGILGASCFGLSDGEASATGIGGNGQYTYEWFRPTDPDSILGTGANLSGVPGGRYIVRIRDANGDGCTFNAAAQIPTPDSLEANLMANSASDCRVANGFALVNPSGGTGPYDIMWSNGSTNDTIENLLSGRYDVIVTDSNDCVTITPFWISTSSGPNFHIDTLQEDNCGLDEGIVGVVLDSGNAPMHIIWGANVQQNTDTSFFAYGIRRTNPGRKVYSVTVIDIDSCLQVRTFGMPGNDPLQIDSEVITNNYCDLGNGTATVNFSGGTLPYNYEWTTSPPQTTTTARSLIAGNYEVTITDSFLCTLTASVEVMDDPGFTLTTSSTDESCYDAEDGSATASVSGHRGSISYEWNSVPAQITPTALNLPGGSYNVTAIDSEGCERKGFEIVDSKEFIQADFTYLPDTMGPVILNQEYQFINRSEGGDFYLWDFGDGNQSQNPSPFHVYADTGSYFVTLVVTDSSGNCKDEIIQGPFRVVLDGVLHVPNAFTPNGDGFNDFLHVRGELIQDYEIRIFSRWGAEVFFSESINNSWDGRLSSGRYAPEGVYVFVLKATIPGQNPILQKGTITVIH